MKKPFFSIIIPTYNEEEYLPKLLDSLERQTFKDFEIIVSDSESTDKTLELAKASGAKIISNPKKHPGNGRNLGAKEANGKWLFFLDADTYLEDKESLQKTFEKLKDTNDIAGGTFKLEAYDGNKSGKFLIKLGDVITDLAFKTKNYFVSGCCLFVRKDLFEDAKGFNEDMEFNEDHDLVRRIHKKTGKKLIKIKIVALTSARRFEALGTEEALRQYLTPTAEYLLQGKMSDKHKFVPGTDLKKNQNR